MAIVVCHTILGIVIERLAYKPYAIIAPHILAVLITAIGVSYFLQNARCSCGPPTPRCFSSVVPEGSVSSRWRPAHHSLCDLGDHRRLHRHRTGAGVVHRQDQDGQGHAGLLRGQGRCPAHGHQRGRDDLHDVRHRLRPCRGRGRAALLGVSDARPTTGSMPGIKAFHRRRVRRYRLHSPARCSADCCWALSRSWPRRTSPRSCANAIVFVVLILVLLVKPTGLLGKQVPESVRWEMKKVQMEPQNHPERLSTSPMRR